ncbi:MAG TPA: TadE/TadG family type IV pilus assembly protein [Gemmataceae bacterium]|jgi:hypothetical protein|nr:TadE/TadG family type IV pilus assembly protein [Gemmataceae bacterium]
MRRSTPPNPRARRGSVAVETLLFLPLFLIVLLAFVEFAAIVTCEQQLVRASHAGAKCAAEGATCEQIREVIDYNLGRGALCGHRRISVCRVVKNHHGHEHLVPVEDPECLPPHTLLVVTVEAPAARVVPNLLRCVGIRLSDDELSGQTAIRKE